MPDVGDGTSIDLKRADWVVLLAGQKTRLCSCGCPHTGAVLSKRGNWEHSHTVLSLGGCFECRCQSYKPVPKWKENPR